MSLRDLIFSQSQSLSDEEARLPAKDTTAGRDSADEDSDKYDEGKYVSFHLSGVPGLSAPGDTLPKLYAESSVVSLICFNIIPVVCVFSYIFAVFALVGCRSRDCV